MATTINNKLMFRLCKDIIEHPLWKKGAREFTEPNLVSVDELVEFALDNGIDEVTLISDVDGTRCRFTGSFFHIHKIANSTYFALLLAVKDLQKELYEIECNSRIIMQ